MVSRAKTARYERLGARYGKKIWQIAILILCVASFLVVGSWRSFSRQARISIAVMGDPVWVWSWDTLRNRFVAVKIPPDSLVEGVHGYGKYSLESLWQLGLIDSVGGTLFATSLEEALGVPVRWYLGGKKTKITSSSTPLAALKDFFSLTGVNKYFSGMYATNIPALTFLRLMKAVQFLRPDRVNSISLAPGKGLVEEELPDATKVLVVDPSQLDILWGNIFEDETVRREALTVAIYNTTQVSSLGVRAARILGHLGVVVVTVGNDEPVIERCQLSGAKPFLESATARLITEVLDCATFASSEESRADLIVRLGTAYEARFSPLMRKNFKI